MLKYISFIFFILYNLTNAGAQSRASLEEERNRIIKEIELTQKNLERASRSKSAKFNELKALQDNMSKREELIINIKKSIEQAASDIQKNNEQQANLLNEIGKIKHQYYQLIRYQYLKKMSGNTWIYLLSAKNLNDALIRWRYAKQFENFTLNKSVEVHKISEEIEFKNKIISENKTLQEELLKTSSEQYQMLQTEREKENRILKDLSKDEARLRKELEKAQSEREKLNKAIEDAIIAELERRDKEKSRKAEDSAIALSELFEDNRGRFPWPVDKGYISNPFGVQPHPSIKGLKINNNGVDIASTPGALVKSIHNGKVIGITSIPGYENMVIVQHGNFYTVYSKLSSVEVKNNQQVKTGAVLGKLADDNTILHFEVWKNKSKVDPELWLRKGS
ncbi:MAG TPA: peptidoglycan DD-metalloendopeptidase family protein [Saprospiraceae bacterium]|nr:peptidoglycan DD-metalloendopeptidase family protein [Saprospiraceae bacterium]